MFYEFVKSKVQAEKIKIHPPARGNDHKIHIEAEGIITKVALLFLSEKERQQIADLSKYIAMRQSKVSQYIQK